jgi:hypothetical protein
MAKQKKSIRHFLDKKLLLRLRLFLIIGLLIGGFVIFECIKNEVNPLFALGGFVVGFGVGAIMAKVYNLSLKEEKVVSQMDKTGIIILAVYILFAISRNTILGNFIHGSELSVFTLSITVGVMIGRVVFIHRGIKDLLEAAGVS